MPRFTTTLSLPETLSERRSILIVHREGVGDDILSIPFLTIVARELKDHDLYLLVGPARRELFLGLDGYRVVEPWEHDEYAAVLGLHHDVVFDLETRHNHLTDWLFSPDSLRYSSYVGFAKSKSIDREIAIPRAPDIPMWQQFISLASAIGLPTDPTPNCVIETSPFSKKCIEMLVNLENELPLISIAPGTAGDRRKRWPPENFASLIRKIHAVRPSHFVIVGERFEMGIGDAIAGLVEMEIDNLMGLTTVGSFVHIIKQSSLVAANDNGAMHLGGLMNIPTVGLFGPSDPVQFQPLGMKSVVLTAPSGIIADIDASSVAAECLGLLDLEYA
jgi:ADP-heptose:LPS heptosyltransferase